MIHPIERLSELVSAAVVRVFGPEQQAVDPAVHRSAFADYQADVSLRLAGRLKKKPLDVANALAAAIDAGEWCEEVKVSPPGFLNFRLRASALEGLINELSRDERAGVPRSSEPLTVVIDYPSPNVAKEMHVGHLRSAVIGDSLSRLLEFVGHRVVRQNHVGDWGTQFGMLLEHLIDVGADAAVSELALGAVNDFYRAARVKFDNDPTFADRARHRVVQLQAGDAESLRLWQTLVDASLKYMAGIYAKLGLRLVDADLRGESFYNPRLAPLADDLAARGIAVVDQGALCVMLPEFKGRGGETQPLIVRKQDGGFGYAATDLAGLQFRVEELAARRILYVVGSPQQQHLAMVFAAARRAGILPDGVVAEHVAFGQILGPDRKLFRTRSGDTPKLTDLLSEAIERADAAVREKNPDLAPESRERVAREVGIGALKYADLSSERIKDYIFDWQRMLSFEGNTGPYLQYAHARICAILRRAAESGNALALELVQGRVPVDARVMLGEPSERALALELLELSTAIDAVGVALQPHRLCGYLYDLASRFTTFYETCPVLKAETNELRDSRLLLAAAARRALAIGLELLGIAAPERM